jgi:hypothetical protein
MVPVDLLLVPADTHNGVCVATETTLNVTNPLVSIPHDTFCPVLANWTVPVDVEFVPADIQTGI